MTNAQWPNHDGQPGWNGPYSGQGPAGAWQPGPPAPPSGPQGWQPGPVAPTGHWQEPPQGPWSGQQPAWAQQQWQAPERKKRSRVLAIVGAVAVAVVVVLAATGAFSGGHDVAVSFSLSDEDLDDSCVGSGGYGDIGPGTPVRLTDESGRLLGATSLGSGSYYGGGCLWSVTIPDVDDADFYSVEVGDRGQISSSADELEASGWNFSVSLG